MWKRLGWTGPRGRHDVKGDQSLRKALMSRGPLDDKWRGRTTGSGGVEEAGDTERFGQKGCCTRGTVRRERGVPRPPVGSSAVDPSTWTEVA